MVTADDGSINIDLGHAFWWGNPSSGACICTLLLRLGRAEQARLRVASGDVCTDHHLKHVVEFFVVKNAENTENKRMGK